MSVTVVVGGQYGSEGKGKVAACLAKEQGASAVIRCGGSNSGHTVYDDEGRRFVFRHLPTACLQPKVKSILASGSYIDVDVLLSEIRLAGVQQNSLYIDPHAVVITEEHKWEEQRSGLTNTIGSTGSGTGAAVIQRLRRSDETIFAKDIDKLSPFLGDTKSLIHDLLDREERVIVEGTQGFGLSLLHSEEYPYVTTRDTTAAGFISECGISPLQVDDIVLVIRSFPIRVAGNSGPLKEETDWPAVSCAAGVTDCVEYTSVTKKVRRVARFDPHHVKDAIRANRPSRIVLNHLDYIEEATRHEFLHRVELSIEAQIDLVGLSPLGIESSSSINDRVAFNVA